MSTPRRPQDFRSKTVEAVSLQAANLLQKAQLDMMATKIVMVLKVQKAVWERIPKRTTGVAADLAESLGEIGRILSMTREETNAARPSFIYNDDRVQAVIDKATEDIAAIILENV